MTIDQSMLDSKNGKLTNIDELIKEIDGWVKNLLDRLSK
jgi:hypothetical protein